MSGVDVAVVIISHGHEGFLPRCLRSLPPALEGLRAEVVVVDNLGASAMRRIVSESPVPVMLRINAVPRGFASNCNMAIGLSGAPYILLLNPDTEFLSGKLKDALDFMRSDQSTGVVGCHLVNSDGEQQESYRQYPTLPVFLARILGAERWPWRPGFYRRSMMEGERFTAPATVDLVTGACFLIRRACFDQIGGFDEGFFLYWEDADFCYRARLSGSRTCFYPAITVLHHHQRSSRTVTSRYARWHVQSAMRFFWKHGFVLRPAAPSPV